MEKENHGNPWLFAIPGFFLIVLVLLFTTKGVQVIAMAIPALKGFINKNPGNLRPTEAQVSDPSQWWDGMTGISNNFCVFDTFTNGLRAMAVNAIRKQQEGATTLRSFGLAWAPPDDNGGATDYGVSLADHIAKNTGNPVGPDDTFDLVAGTPFILSDLCKAITQNENGVNPLPNSDYTQAVTLAWNHVNGEVNQV